MKISNICFFTLILVLASIQFSCKSSEQKKDVPTCITSKIEALKNEPVQNPPAEVWKWETKDNIYYYVISPCCDQYNYLYNNSCEVICAPDGGFTGKGDQKCPAFGVNVTKTLIWKDLRKAY